MDIVNYFIFPMLAIVIGGLLLQYTKSDHARLTISWSRRFLDLVGNAIFELALVSIFFYSLGDWLLHPNTLFKQIYLGIVVALYIVRKILDRRAYLQRMQNVDQILELLIVSATGASQDQTPKD